MAGVVAQQGRVTIEADWNEQRTIAAEQERAALLDVIGPSATPDHGYAVSLVYAGGDSPPTGAPTGDLTIAQGTLYVGGERMILEEDLDYASQPDWVDNSGDPLWVSPSIPSPPEDLDELVYLLLREQEVGAVEDPALLDVALGGPDTAERLRIVQRVVRLPFDGTTCAQGLADLNAYWEGFGLNLDAATMRLRSGALLQVSFQQEPSTSPCEPVAQGGYLGAQNQLIRVQVARVDQGVPTLVWGFDDAYFMYRFTYTAANVDTGAGTTTITLDSVPVDTYHQPAAKQAVEVLQSAAQITDTDYIAATTGLVTQVTDDGAYDPNSGQVVIASAALPLPVDAGSRPGPTPLFLRVWQDTIAYTGPGPVALGDTGIQVTLTLSPGASDYHVGDCWLFAVRPGTPTTVSPVYPQRILDFPQPPDGPRMWACPLAVVDWSGEGTVTQCPPPFPNLGSLGGASGCCCTVSVTPDSVDGGGELQALLDKYLGQGPTTICLQPGTYTLPQPLVIRRGYSHLTIEGCGGAVTLQGPARAGREFALGLILVDGVGEDGVSGLTLRGLNIAIPQAEFTISAAAFAGIPEALAERMRAYADGLTLAIGVYLLAGTGVEIESCTFSFAEDSGNVFGAGVLAARTIDGLRVVDCSFTAPETATAPFSALAQSGEGDPPYQVRFGYLQVPTNLREVTLRPLDATAASSGEASVLAEAGDQAPAATTGTTTTLVATAEEGATDVRVLSVSGMVAGDQLVIDTGNLAETVQIVTVGTAGVEGSGVTITPPLARAHKADARVVVETQAAASTSIALPSLADAAVEGNLFDGVTVPLLVIGQVGTARIEDNTVRSCYGGIWLVTASSTVVVTLIDALPPGVRELADEFSTTGTTALLDPVLLFATAIGRVLPASPEGSLGVIALPTTVALGQARALFAQVVPDVPLTSAATSPPETTAATLAPSFADLFDRTDFAVGPDAVAEVDPGTGLIPRLQLSGNQIDAILAESDSGAGLLVAIFDSTDKASLIASANRIRSRVVNGAAVSLLRLTECAFSGSVVANELVGDNERSLVLAPYLIDEKVALVAVSGNVFVGEVTWLPTSLGLKWTPLNAIMQYIAGS